MTRRTPDVPRDLVPLTDAGALIGLNRQTVRRMISRGHLTGYRIGVASNAPVLVSRAEVLSLVETIPAAPRSA